MASVEIVDPGAFLAVSYFASKQRRSKGMFSKVGGSRYGDTSKKRRSKKRDSEQIDD